MKIKIEYGYENLFTASYPYFAYTHIDGEKIQRCGSGYEEAKKDLLIAIESLTAERKKIPEPEEVEL